MNEDQREKIKTAIFNFLKEFAFEDDAIDEIIYEGAKIKGLNNMTDEELVQEYENFVTDDEDDELLKEVQLSIAIDKKLKE